MREAGTPLGVEAWSPGLEADDEEPIGGWPESEEVDDQVRVRPDDPAAAVAEGVCCSRIVETESVESTVRCDGRCCCCCCCACPLIVLLLSLLGIPSSPSA